MEEKGGGGRLRWRGSFELHFVFSLTDFSYRNIFFRMQELFSELLAVHESVFSPFSLA